MLKALIVDDELMGCQALKKLLELYAQDIYVMQFCHSADEGARAIQVLNPDLVFLDIQMPGKSGFDMLDGLERIDFEVIFTTGFDHYAVKAFKIGAVDYLLKPIDGDELEAAIQRASERIKTKKSSAQNVEVLLQNLRGGQSESMQMALPTQEGIFYVPIREIVRCESDANYTIFHFMGRKKIMVSKNLKEYEELLSPYGFVRVHNQYLINLRQVKKYIKGEGGTVVMNDDAQIEVARRRKEVFLVKLSKLTIR
ncbi:LytR/AlgR family response regulator transcription factor [Runella limosa]|uniref:LytR/AlgR family response regulator transcription factor n=1 Tax=Runella limosa TaxID=370978 RepID=UPI000407C1FF|nr:LytTR family DNA-binding domain-containing protein [Runella limosa]